MEKPETPPTTGLAASAVSSLAAEAASPVSDWTKLATVEILLSMTPITAAEQVVGFAASPDADIEPLKPMGQAFFNSLNNANPSEAIDGLGILGRGINVPNPAVAAFIAMMCGALIERGAPAEAIAEPLLARLRTSATLARVFLNACKVDMPPDVEAAEAHLNAAVPKFARSMPNEYAGWEMLQKLFPPAIAAFSSSASLRKRGKSELGDLKELAEIHPGARWIEKLTGVLDQEPFLAIEPATGVGIIGKMSGISENFQLNVLLMGTFPGAIKPRVSEKAMAIAKGDGPQMGDEIMTGCWNLNTWKAVGPDRRLPDPKNLGGRNHWIWNEGIPSDIPTFEGFRVILLTPPAYMRTWKSQRDFLALRAELSIEQQLDSSQVNQWLMRMAVARR